MDLNRKRGSTLLRYDEMPKYEKNNTDNLICLDQSLIRKCQTVSFTKKKRPFELQSVAQPKKKSQLYKVRDTLGIIIVPLDKPNKNKIIHNNHNQTLDFFKVVSQKYQQEKENEEINLIVEDSSLLEQNKLTRDHMEDYISVKRNFLEDNMKLLYVLCDGHCGDSVAKLVNDRLPYIFEQTLLKFNFEIEKSLLESFCLMDEELTEFEESGSTCCLVYICIENGERVVYSANIGDSRTIIVKNKEAKRLSYDHKASDKSEAQRVKNEGGAIIRGRLYSSLAITRGFGDYSFKGEVKGLINVPHITRTVIEKDDKYVIIASDGIWDVINEAKAFELIQKSNLKNSEEIVKLLVESSISFGSKDNISCIVIKLNYYV